MVPHFNNVRSLSPSDLAALVRGAADEGLQLEFKRDAYARDLDEWCKDLSAMANTAGGVILMGVREQDGRAAELVGLPTAECDALIRALTQKYCSAIRPVPTVILHPVDLGTGRAVLLAGIPPSRFRPHACRQGTRFYKRMERNVQDMDREDLQRAFAASISEEEAALAIHAPRVQHWGESGDAPVVVLDAIPAPADQERFDLSDAKQLTTVRSVFGSSYWVMASDRITFQGLLYANEQRGELRIQRSGAVLAAMTRSVFFDHRAIPAVDLVETLIQRCSEALQVIRKLDASCPVHLCFSLARCANWTLRIHDRWMLAPQPIEQPTLTLPVLYWSEQVPEDRAIMRLLRPWFDRLWHAAALRSCHLYDRTTGEPDWQAFVRWR